MEDRRGLHSNRSEGPSNVHWRRGLSAQKGLEKRRWEDGVRRGDGLKTSSSPAVSQASKLSRFCHLSTKIYLRGISHQEVNCVIEPPFWGWSDPSPV